jgi:hypothetical protein
MNRGSGPQVMDNSSATVMLGLKGMAVLLAVPGAGQVAWSAPAVVDYGTPLIEHPDCIDGVAAVGVDETAFLRARPGCSTAATRSHDQTRSYPASLVTRRSRVGANCALGLGRDRSWPASA